MQKLISDQKKEQKYTEPDMRDVFIKMQRTLSNRISQGVLVQQRNSGS